LAAIHSRQAEMILDQERDLSRGFFERGKKKMILEEKKEGCLQKK
jgi:hypothetical protein